MPNPPRATLVPRESTASGYPAEAAEHASKRSPSSAGLDVVVRTCADSAVSSVSSPSMASQVRSQELQASRSIEGQRGRYLRTCSPYSMKVAAEAAMRTAAVRPYR